jgi:hypothetical protein
MERNRDMDRITKKRLRVKWRKSRQRTKEKKIEISLEIMHNIYLKYCLLLYDMMIDLSLMGRIFYHKAIQESEMYKIK